MELNSIAGISAGARTRYDLQNPAKAQGSGRLRTCQAEGGSFFARNRVRPGPTDRPGQANGVDPVAYLANVLLLVQIHPVADIDALLPDRWRPLDTS